MSDTRDAVSIIGAGPSGLMAAITLRRHGIPARVFEMHGDVGQRLSGDFQGIENWSTEKDAVQLLGEMGVETDFFLNPFSTGTVFARGMEPARVNSARPIFYLVRRGAMPGALDAALKEQALSLGAEIVFNRRVSDLQGTAIVSTGPGAACMVAAGLTFETPSGDRAVVVLDDALAPAGYAYLLISGGLGTLATVLYRDFRKANACLEQTIGFLREKTGIQIRSEKRFGAFGNFFICDSLVRGGRLYAGESAGFQDCLWGFGLRYALRSGYLAAKSIIEGSDYDALWKKELLPALETSLLNRFLFETFGHAGYRYLARRFSGGDPCGYLRGHYNPSPLKRLLLPLAKMKFRKRTERKGLR